MDAIRAMGESKYKSGLLWIELALTGKKVGPPLLESILLWKKVLKILKRC